MQRPNNIISYSGQKFWRGNKFISNMRPLLVISRQILAGRYNRRKSHSSFNQGEKVELNFETTFNQGEEPRKLVKGLAFRDAAVQRPSHGHISRHFDWRSRKLKIERWDQSIYKLDLEILIQVNCFIHAWPWPKSDTAAFMFFFLALFLLFFTVKW